MSTPIDMLPLILFDLDGTLVDSSGDLTAGLNDIRADLGLAPVPVARIRNTVSAGGRAVLQRGLPELPAQEREDHLPALLAAYRIHIGAHDGLFAGMETVLEGIEAAGSIWGVVTNKNEDLARIVLERLELASRCAVLIGGDTLSARKPDPLPVLEACRRLQQAPSRAVYVGDDPRDIIAGREAGTRTLAVRWGFHAEDEDPARWGADQVLDAPLDLLLPGVLGA